MAIHWYLAAFLVLLFSSALSSWSMPAPMSPTFELDRRPTNSFLNSNHHSSPKLNPDAHKYSETTYSHFEQSQHKDEKTPVDNRDQTRQSAIGILKESGDQTGNSHSTVNEEFNAALKSSNWKEIMKMDLKGVQVGKALEEASKQGNAEAMLYLLSHGSHSFEDVAAVGYDWKDRNGKLDEFLKTRLKRVLTEHIIEMVGKNDAKLDNYLVEKGAFASNKDLNEYRESMKDSSFAQDHLANVMSNLNRRRINDQFFQSAIEAKQWDLVKKALKNGPQLELSDETKILIMEAASAQNQLDVVSATVKLENMWDSDTRKLLSSDGHDLYVNLKTKDWNKIMKMDLKGVKVDEIIPEVVPYDNHELLKKVLSEGLYDPETLHSDPTKFLDRDSPVMKIEGQLKIHFESSMKQNKPDFVADLVRLDIVDVKEVLELSSKNQEFYNALVQNRIIQKRLTLRKENVAPAIADSHETPVNNQNGDRNEKFNAAVKSSNWNEIMSMDLKGVKVDESIPALLTSKKPILLKKVLSEGLYDPETLHSNPADFLVNVSPLMTVEGQLKIHFDSSMKQNKPDFVADLVRLDLVDVKEVLSLSAEDQDFYNALVQNPTIQRRLIINNDLETIRSLIKKGSVRAEDILKEATKTNNFYVSSSIVDPKTVKNDLTERFNNGQWEQLTQMNLKNVNIDDLLDPKGISKLEEKPEVLRYLLSQGSFSLESVLKAKSELKPDSPVTSLLESAVDKRLSEIIFKRDIKQLSSLVEDKKIKLDRIMDLADEATLKSLVKTKAIQDSLFKSNKSIFHWIITICIFFWIDS